jgi:hypothetical protein
MSPSQRAESISPMSPLRLIPEVGNLQGSTIVRADGNRAAHSSRRTIRLKLRGVPIARAASSLCGGNPGRDRRGREASTW